MTSSEPQSYNNGDPKRQRLPTWVWGLSACACLPIIAIFALGLLAMPVMKRMREAQRETARTSICLNNVRELAGSLQMYSSDYDDHYPVASVWMDTVAPYGRNGAKSELSLQCPTVRGAPSTGFGYAFNNKLSGSAPSKITAPATTQLVYDSTNLSRNANDMVSSLPKPARHRTRARRRIGGTRVNIMGYVDGHARAVSEQGKGVQAPGLDTSQ